MSDSTVSKVWVSLRSTAIPDIQVFCHECAALYIPEKKTFYINQPVWVGSIQGILLSKDNPFMYFADSTEVCIAQWTFPSIELRDEVHARVIEEITNSLVLLT